jgi:hypothetical protein
MAANLENQNKFGVRVSGTDTDLDTLFEPRNNSTQGSTMPNLKGINDDFSDRYVHIDCTNLPSTVYAPVVTNINYGGVDLGSIFRKRGTAPNNNLVFAIASTGVYNIGTQIGAWTLAGKKYGNASGPVSSAITPSMLYYFGVGQGGTGGTSSNPVGGGGGGGGSSLYGIMTSYAYGISEGLNNYQVTLLNTVSFQHWSGGSWQDATALFGRANPGNNGGVPGGGVKGVSTAGTLSLTELYILGSGNGGSGGAGGAAGGAGDGHSGKITTFMSNEIAYAGGGGAGGLNYGWFAGDVGYGGGGGGFNSGGGGGSGDSGGSHCAAGGGGGGGWSGGGAGTNGYGGFDPKAGGAGGTPGIGFYY